ncbi:hypothetical protein AG1IA_08470 [Rhizoctonia solani AG-1 IA]|uniref:Uncharacterized protein n=1 Tax=Thanatephorus cucumeris (strain AG1-IA) TaxID=983506 RepID=L8WMB6_THACA|nr:hypothetical protein AG1IA_08470 [Rhizoctonia solani AG-1 IA]
MVTSAKSILDAVLVEEPGTAKDGLGVSGGPSKTANVCTEGSGWQRTISGDLCHRQGCRVITESANSYTSIVLGALFEVVG